MKTMRSMASRAGTGLIGYVERLDQVRTTHLTAMAERPLRCPSIARPGAGPASGSSGVDVVSSALLRGATEVGLRLLGGNLLQCTSAVDAGQAISWRKPLGLRLQQVGVAAPRLRGGDMAPPAS
ncbi:MAG TPA: hypothetical protein VMW75_22385, partial [Thermoanaerobaculia bacterium]|nr:hypothetical protein [Thermoanaerobaculia bacterium]